MQNYDYRFILDTKSKKSLCPECKRKTFVRFIDNATNEYLPGKYGRCDREIKCNYHLNPYKDRYFQRVREQEKGNGVNFQKSQLAPHKLQPKQGIKEPSFIPYEILKATRKDMSKILLSKTYCTG